MRYRVQGCLGSGDGVRYGATSLRRSARADAIVSRDDDGAARCCTSCEGGGGTCGASYKGGVFTP